MRKILLFILITCFLSSKGQDIDVLHYKYQLTLNDLNDSIQGEAEIRYVIKHLTLNIRFDLFGDSSKTKGLKIINAWTNGTVSSYNMTFKPKFSNNILEIVNGASNSGDTLTAFIQYKGIPDDGLIISKNKYGDRTFFADNWPNRAHHWIPCVDQPNDKASFEFIVHAPSHYNVISNGVKIEEKTEASGMKMTHWKEDMPSPTKVMVIGVAKFATKTFEDSPPNLPISAWVYPQDSTKGFYDYALAPGIVKFFASYIAPFPYKKLANVQSKTVFGGMENASCIFYAEESITGDRSSEDLLAHEIAHQWFGDMASEKSFAHLWLSEGFATYLTDLYFEYKYGKEGFQKRLQKERKEAIEFSKLSTHAVVDSTTDLMSLLNANSYQKGAWVLHMLRGEVGDSAFHKIIQTYYHQYKGSNAETRDFERVAEQISGKDLKWFFDQWLYQSGIPQLRISSVQTEDGVSIKVEQLQKNLFNFPLPIRIETTSTKEKSTVLQITKRVETWKLAGGKLVNLKIDSDNTILFDRVK